ncbi:hypothetical protein CSKR_201801 [Clonorchis sinensis]|uniref:Uncharacterized protein n=1 Tax=Clonorchis sinensis TaxID=79923 RepID=A0A8T1MY48_CLOSI|nr:hypothetical protein CSKR_201801 [Clonorchis sinensis]
MEPARAPLPINVAALRTPVLGIQRPLVPLRSISNSSTVASRIQPTRRRHTYNSGFQAITSRRFAQAAGTVGWQTEAAGAKAARCMKHLIVQTHLMLRRNSATAQDIQPPVLKDNRPQPSTPTDDVPCGLCGQPTDAADCWCPRDRLPYHRYCCANEPCPLCGEDLQVCPPVAGLSRKRSLPSIKRSAKRACYDVDLDRSMEAQPSVARKTVAIKLFCPTSEQMQTDLAFESHDDEDFV